VQLSQFSSASGFRESLRNSKSGILGLSLLKSKRQDNKIANQRMGATQE
jgi:hypothetical protein